MTSEPINLHDCDFGKLAKHIARRIFAFGDDRDRKATRLQFMAGRFPDNETPTGGLVENALVMTIEQILNELPDQGPQHTGLYDSDGMGIVVGAILRQAVEGNQDVHGEWAEYRVELQGLTPVLRYVRSEKGAVLPEGYLASLLAEHYSDKMFLFAKNLSDLRPVERLVVRSKQ